MPAPMIHPRTRIHGHALVEEGASVGADTRVWAFVHILPGARIGAGCNLCDGVFVEGQVVLGDYVTVKNGVALYDGVTLEDEVFVGPHAAFTNDLWPRAGRHKGTPAQFRPTRVRRGASIGANATILCGLEIGSCAMIAAGAVVTKNVPAHALVRGQPARRVGWVCACGHRLDEKLACACGLRYRQRGDGLETLA